MSLLSSLEPKLNSDRLTSLFLQSLDVNQMNQVGGEIYAKLYWLKRNPHWKKGSDSRSMLAKLRRVQRRIKKMLASGKVRPELTIHGSILKRESSLAQDAYHYKNLFLSGPKWKPFWDVGMPYVGVFINNQELSICQYVEGDVITIIARDEQSFRREQYDIDRFYMKEFA